MPPHYSRLPELKTPDNIIIDVKPMQNALMERRKAMEFDINKDLEDQKLAQQASQFAQTKDLQERQFGLRQAEHEQNAADRKIKMIGGLAQVIDDEPDPRNRQTMWNRMRGMHPEFDSLLTKYGVDPNDHVNGPKFVMAQVGGYDPQKKAERESTINYRNAMTADATSRASAREMEASTKRFKVIADAGLLNNPNMSEAEWNQHNQPGGVINAAFGGVPVPYSQAPYILAQARREIEKSFEPTEEDKLAGITREDKIRAYRSQRAAELHGVSNEKLTLKGQRMTPQGTMESIPGAGNTATERQGAIIAKQGLDLLTQGEAILKKSGTLDQLAGDNWKPFGVQVGSWGEAGRGFAAVKSAIIDLNFALSGKNVSNAEREAFLDLYMPKSTDSAATQAFKIKRVRNYFTEVLRMRQGNASDEEVNAAYQRAIRDGEKGPDSPSTKNEDRLPGKGVRGLSNDELLKRLQE